MLSELGASGGLNLQWDSYALETATAKLPPVQPLLMLSPDWQGATPPTAQIAITDRAGVDLTPIDPQSPEGLLRLLSYTWPDQTARLERIRTAAPKQSTKIAQGDAAEWLPARLKAQKKNTLHLVYHTIAMQYFPQAVKDKCRAALFAAGAQATPETPLAWLSMEADTRDQDGAALNLHIWPEDRQISLGRADFHGRWVHWEKSKL